MQTSQAAGHSGGVLMAAKIAEVVNVARVPFRSPFRYPGGKTWLVPRVRQWLRSRDEKPRHFIEPFAGGAIVGLTVAFENLADEVTLVELDEDVASVWQTILSDDGEWLVERIADFDMSLHSVERAVQLATRSTRDRAFATILRNRINRGGILAPGAGRMRNGENGKGLRSRWYAETLCRRIRDIISLRAKLRFVHGDGLDAMEKSAAAWETSYFIDPPYTVAGRRLYLHSEIDHERLFGLAAVVRGGFLMTYDHCEHVLQLAEQFRMAVAEVAMKTTHHSKKTELFISRDMAWLTEPCLAL
jgi:DNA adenine methylase